jgi:hypothetical protein
MERGYRSVWSLLAASAIVLVLPAALSAQTLQAPEFVLADETGSFMYDGSFTAGPGGDVFASYVVDGTANTSIGVIVVDGFCLISVEEGQEIPISVAGSLLDPASAGSVFIHFSTGCPGGSGQSLAVETIIESAAPAIVDIDIKPDSDLNAINPFARGVIPVAILGSDTLDVADVDVTTLAFGTNGAPIKHDLDDSADLAAHVQDVNEDGLTDLVSHYTTRDTGIVGGDMRACLTGETFGGVLFGDCDEIITQTPSGAGGGACGLGFELALLVPLLEWRRRGYKSLAI